MDKLFGTDGIRGQANRHPITPEMALQVGKAIARAMGARGHGSKRAVIGKDTRLSGYMIETALTSGLVSMGADVFLVGPVPTPAVAHLTKSLAADAGIMVTASHNPFDDNGIKLFSPDGYKLDDAMEAEIARLVLSGEISSEHIRSDQIGKAYRIDDASGRYIEFAKSTIRNEKLNPLTIVLDCANGAAYHIAPLIFRELGAEVVKINVAPDGYNINNNCGALHPRVVAEQVRERKADLGIALDGDADRVIFCDAHGHTVDGDRILAMCAVEFQRRGALARDTLVCTTMSNLGLHEAMARHKIGVVTTDVGDRHVIDAMRTHGFSVGGEKSGHVIFHDYATTGDGIITALQVMRLMRLKQAPLAALADCMTEYPHRIVSLPVREMLPIDTLPGLSDAIRQAGDELAANGRVLVRYSGTEKKIRLLVEAREQVLVEKWIARLTEAVRAELG
ncbi:MAG: phosphoglucosamine mutase [bacterium]